MLTDLSVVMRGKQVQIVPLRFCLMTGSGNGLHSWDGFLGGYLWDTLAEVATGHGGEMGNL